MDCGDFMLKIDRIDTEFGPSFNISTDEGVFRILYGGNLDLYWDCYCDANILNGPLEKVFYITKENYFLYLLIDEVYSGIKNFEPYSFCFYSDWEEDSVKSYKNMREMFISNDNRPFLDDSVLWYSDDIEKEYASCLKIEKLDDCYKVIFVKSKCRNYLTYSIRFRNSGSNYHPYNCLFMNMYNKLSEYDTSYHQIHIEEYLYRKKLKIKSKN